MDKRKEENVNDSLFISKAKRGEEEKWWKNSKCVNDIAKKKKRK